MAVQSGRASGRPGWHAKTTGCFSVAVFLGPACASWPRHRGSAREFVPDAYIRVYPDGRVVYVLCRAEMRQGIYTSEATLVADELGLDPGALEVELSPVDPAYNNPAMGPQSTGGSTSTRAHFAPLRAAGARAHRALQHAAAELLQVRPVELEQDQRFSFPYLPHQPMEPLDATARVHCQRGRPVRAELWLGTQAPDLVRAAVARAAP